MDFGLYEATFGWYHNEKETTALRMKVIAKDSDVGLHHLKAGNGVKVALWRYGKKE